MESCHTIQGYYYKSTPIFYGEVLRYLGVELEIDSGGENHVNARTLLNITNTGKERAYCSMMVL